ncbi:MAG: DNA mismatch repair protein MutS, partial [Planctomycetes bacterium]|nr:DNA mismatch repair protein MutS [Planctomycetota bacterium]
MASGMMQQYHDAKQACGDALLLFRMGDFYELFYEDARAVARTLNLTLTSRDKGENPIPMAGFPYHQLDSYLAKLIAAGFRVAVCEQVEDAKQAKGLVRREVTRIVTPGTLTDDALLDPRESNYLAAVVTGPASDNDAAGLAWVDLSTGRFFASRLPPSQLADELARIAPAECLAAQSADAWIDAVAEKTSLTRRPDWAFAQAAAAEALAKHFGTASLEGFGFEAADGPAIRAAGAILDYLSETQKTSLEHIDRLVPYRRGDRLEIDESTRRSLEIVRTMREGCREGSLLSVLDRTVTAMGARMLADQLANPLTDVADINERLDAVGELVDNASLSKSLRDLLDGVYDLERLLARVTTGRSSPRDLSFIGRTLGKLPAIKAKLTARSSDLLSRLESDLDLCPDLRGKLEAALVDDCPLVSREGGFIRDGYHEPLDALRELTRGGKQWIAQYQAREAERSGIPNLKIGFNRVFGYYLEVTHSHKDKVPEEYIRKQTIKSAERYITPELKEHEEKLLSADEKSNDLESELFVELRDAVAGSLRRLQNTARILAQIDTLSALATLARDRNYCRPQLTDEPVLQITAGRHPVLDATEPQGTFVPNDTVAGADEGLFLLITGPNMA